MELQMPKHLIMQQGPTVFLPDTRSRILLEKRQRIRLRSQQKATEVQATDETQDVVFLPQSSQAFEPLCTIDTDQVVLLEDSGHKEMDVQPTPQEEVLPQEVVVVSYNDEVPSEGGVIAYDDNGQILLIRESDIKSVDTYRTQHLIHTFDGTTYIIDSNAEAAAAEPTYIVWDEPVAADAESFVIDGLSLGTLEVTEDGSAACIVTEDSSNDTYGFQNWNDFEIYQAMTSFRIAETSETSSILTQSPIMSTVENPSCMPCNAGGYEFCEQLNDDSCANQSLEDSLAKIGVITTEASHIPSTLQLPSTITDPSITSSLLNVTDVDDEDSNSVVYANGEYWQ